MGYHLIGRMLGHLGAEWQDLSRTERIISADYGTESDSGGGAMDEVLLDTHNGKYTL
jgi:hypothetical protein